MSVLSALVCYGVSPVSYTHLDYIAAMKDIGKRGKIKQQEILDSLERKDVAASHSAVSAALVQEKLDGQVKKQVPVYFVSEVLSVSKKNYTELEKVLYVVLMASRKLRHYFQAYNIIVPKLTRVFQNGKPFAL